MKQRIAILVLMLVGLTLGLAPTTVLMANPIGKDEARQKALSFIGERRPAMARGTQQDLTLALTNESYHVFNLGSGDGFVIVSGDDCADDILGYSDSGTFNAEDMPENLRAWLQSYTDQIAWMRANGVKASVLNASPLRTRSNANRAPRSRIAPLLTSKWGQGDPYNQQTPSVLGNQCVTGCVATAMAQVMYYWYKKEGFEASLENDIPANFGVFPILGGLMAPKTFDWANITENYYSYSTTTEENAVAELMKYCGYSVKMDYGFNISNALGLNISTALTGYFGYQTAQFAHQDQYSYEDWQQVIYTDLAAGRPVVLGASTTDCGHEFVCDGYDEDDYYHINWGWYGQSDGYFKLALCNPDEQGIGGGSGGYYMGQHAICCIHPTKSINLPIEPMETASVDDIEVTDVSIPDLRTGESADITVTIKNKNKRVSLNRDIVLSLSNDNIWERIGATTAHINPGATESLTIPASITLLSPGSYWLYVFYFNYDKNFDTVYKKNVNVGAALPNLTGTVGFKDNNAEVGTALSYTLNGDVASLSAGSLHPQWQISKDGRSRWENITGATSTTYTPAIDDAGKYVRVIIKADGYHGELVSDAREVAPPTLEGTVTLSNDRPSPGTILTYKLSGPAADIDPSQIITQWMWSNYSDRGWKSLGGETGQSYTLKPDDLGTFFRVRIMANNHYGFLYSTICQCVKKACTQQVTTPTIEVSTAYNQIRVTNPNTTQEYIIMTSKKAIDMLTESDWGSAKTFNANDNFLFMGGTVNAMNYVYTRVKETETTAAGTDVRMASIYFGETVYVQDIKLDLKKVNLYNNFTGVERDDLGAYYMQCGERYRITAESVPANATNFSGIRGSMWLVKGYSRASQWGRYYSDKECTTLIDADTYYKTVYFKPQDGTMINYMELRAEYTKGYNDVATEAFLVNIATEQGYYKIDQLYVDNVTVGKGETMSNLKFATRPGKAVPSTMSATVTNGEGTAPVITFNPSKKTFSVDATDANKGTFTYAIYVNGSSVTTMRVDVTTPPVEEIRLQPGMFTLDCGESLQLTTLLMPFGAEEDITWSSSNEDVATVSPDGLVTVTQWADIGETATITATIGDLSATSEVTVAGEKYGLYIAGMQVTTRNKDRLGSIIANLSEEGMESWMAGEMDVTFDGSVLRLKNAVINTYITNANGIVINKYGMTMVVEGECSISTGSDVGLKVAKTANIVGDGTLSIDSNDCAILLDNKGLSDEDNEYIKLAVSDIGLSLMGANHAIKGSENDLTSVELNSVSVWAEGSSGAVCDLTGGLGLNDCFIREPIGAVARSGGVWQGDELATYVHITPRTVGDVNNDGSIDVADIASVISIMADGVGADPASVHAADVNDDGVVDVADIAAIISIMAAKARENIK